MTDVVVDVHLLHFFYLPFVLEGVYDRILFKVKERISPP